jgi:hypothetical protein
MPAEATDDAVLPVVAAGVPIVKFTPGAAREPIVSAALPTFCNVKVRGLSLLVLPTLVPAKLTLGGALSGTSFTAPWLASAT